MFNVQNQLTKAKVKLINSLSIKKYRYKNQLFVVEGVKIVDELLKQKNFTIKEIFGTESWLKTHQQQLDNFHNFCLVSENQLQKISNLSKSNQVMALVEIPEDKNSILAPQQLHIVLDDIRDPGNLGTIIRIADWYGLQSIYCSRASVDCFNPKVIQSAMGSLFRVQVQYTDIEKLLTNAPQLPTYGTFMHGNNINNVKWQLPAFLIFGNEANGIQANIENLIHHKVSIPKIGAAESLNLSVATGIFVHSIMG